jgi:TorA maturation chaperone TorD
MKTDAVATRTTSAAGWFALAGMAFLDPDPGRLLDSAAAADHHGPPEDSWPWNAAGIAKTLGGDALDLRREHARLFLSPEGAVCPPWQSAWGPEPRLFGEAHHQVLAWYRMLGIEPKLDNEPADHIGLILTFYGQMLAQNEPPEAAFAFSQGHLCWMPEFCARMQREARHPFYRLMADLVLRLVASQDQAEPA